jgi:hypothetical protein
MTARSIGGPALPGLCVWAVTAAGNQRSTTIGTNCASNVGFMGRCFVGNTPALAYVTWNGGGGVQDLEGVAMTGSDSICG